MMQEDILKNLARADEKCVAFGYKIVVENTISVRFSGKCIGSVVGEKKLKAADCDNTFDRVYV